MMETVEKSDLDISDVSSIRNERELSIYLEKLSSEKNEKTFPEYFLNVLDRKGLRKTDAISASFLDRIYAYQILAGKKNGGREKIISLCIGGDFDIDETQKALTLARMGILYSKNSRDSIIIYSINNHFSIIDTNSLLIKHNENPLDAQ